MTSIYYTPPVPLVPNTIAQSGVLNNDFSVGVDNAFKAVAADVVKRLAHASLVIAAIVTGGLANKSLAFNNTGLALVAGAGMGTWRGLWATGISYNKGDLVADPNGAGVVYIAAAAYVSGATLLADINAGSLKLVINTASASMMPTGFTVSAPTTDFNAALGGLYVIKSGPSLTATLPTMTTGVNVNNSPAPSADIVIVTHPNYVNQVTVRQATSELINGRNATIALINVTAKPFRSIVLFWSGPTRGWISRRGT